MIVVSGKGGGKHFDGDLAAQARIAGAIDLAHSTAPQQ
jgi:hypothetical protein